MMMNNRFPHTCHILQIPGIGNINEQEVF